MLRCLIEAETRLVIRLLNPRQTVRELLEMAELQAVWVLPSASAQATIVLPYPKLGIKAWVSVTLSTVRQ